MDGNEYIVTLQLDMDSRIDRDDLNVGKWIEYKGQIEFALFLVVGFILDKLWRCCFVVNWGSRAHVLGGLLRH